MGNHDTPSISVLRLVFYHYACQVTLQLTLSKELACRPPSTLHIPHHQPGEADWADLQITMPVDCSMGHRPVGALALTWTGCPGHKANTEEKRFTDGACGQVISAPSPHPLHGSPLIPAWSSLPSPFLPPPPHLDPTPCIQHITRKCQQMPSV